MTLHHRIRSWQHQDCFQKLLVVDLHPAVAIRVERGERLCNLLHDNARAYEAVERDPGRSRLVPSVASDLRCGPLNV
jgi:hypothetical protein